MKRVIVKMSLSQLRRKATNGILLLSWRIPSSRCFFWPFIRGGSVWDPNNLEISSSFIGLWSSPSLEKEKEIGQGGLFTLVRKKQSSFKSFNQGAPNSVSKGKDKGDLSIGVGLELPHALVPYELGFTYQLNEESTPTSIMELLRNHVFRASLDISNPRLLGIFYHLVKSSAQGETGGLKPIEELFAGSKRQVRLVGCHFLH